MNILELISGWYANTKIKPLPILPEKPNPAFKISEYDVIIKKYAYKNQIPWQLVCAIIWQESRFNPNAVSSAKCKGLMQLAPCVYEPANIDPFNPHLNIMLGCSHLKTMWTVFKSEKDLERWAFALGAYNGGIGYVVKAQDKAKQDNVRTDVWALISCYLKDIDYKGKKCDWVQICQYVNVVMAKFYEYIFLELKSKGGE